MRHVLGGEGFYQPASARTDPTPAAQQEPLAKEILFDRHGIKTLAVQVRLALFQMAVHEDHTLL
ncbi:hypothetical protein J2X53_003236 [Pseudorhodobacter sp. 4114]|nr:hypothetical protein [Pseudorhodobacter sp. 4114]